MDAITFGIKRAHWVLHHRVVAKVLEPCGLTPSRFDALYILFRNEGLPQKELRRQLGVARSTLSRMLAALERLALVTRDRQSRGRTRRVALTEAGSLAVRYGLYLGKYWRVVYRKLSRMMTFHQRCILEHVLTEVRRAHGQAAEILYPWHPDD